MTGMKSWNVQISIKENAETVNAEARLSGAAAGTMVGEGVARCNPADENVPEIGDELAVARAMSSLSHQLLNTAATDIERHTHKPVRGLGV
ncbi:DUF1876 domain-containing protein [Streptomyces mobaraensis NBRC 13819 = DSM 40847]|uniref:DUF1876 domain-containing protein n=2 Tax=Streptomyces mobaraensis TaxID=35621 RepID=A0A5N5WA95_STRMB|nr:DUF1876 domain-containing protein [Streptomyces mobaraensis]EMF01617.1 hypothetical protein H340_05399 [Streptomyces mobaraensis NBRC 13819 = DSM 40847]KAB7847772.1 DUF1876 domain-containing protein [Streptomyces mobaraensis]QTT74997.1 DUF1876 domain-containing protein [Streptomyces mobaraensis NBRC 13819 = DSM 40847]